jgi:cbb3-type cytochrome oxidase subunit 3
LGEEFELEVVVKGPQGTTWTFPAEALGDEAELRSLSRAASPGAWPPDTHRYVGAIYALGEVELPPLVVGYRLPDSSTGELAVPTAKMRGLSVLPKSGEEQKLSDVRPPVSLGIGRAFWVTLALLLLLVGLVAFLVWRKIRKARPEPEVAPLPLVEPDVEALGALDRLASQALASKGDLRGHYIALTAIAKRYLERRLGAPILEMTTAETLAFLRDQTEGREAHSVMRDVSGAADSIKFARGTAAVEEASRHLDAVRGMVRDTEERRSAALAAVAPSSGPPPQMGQGSSPVGRSLERESGRHTPAASAGTEPPPSGGTA